ncbi:MarR family transcriptional regulator [Pseudonocardia sp. EC080610-09]|nr:MarR family transcriptional regulator [Pseudonocardia sp. EC080625-04]ALL74891.1 MarR family transcriptional regulator [Pseudonocardia sp. EC080610-09]ALL81913.1 MarR family transcriptional regulator [Pseudonocardia sp. EC080619-01]OLM21523.1 Transcriptional regulator, MarR family [Pseudonocardia sp. Ae707_Ps1]
MTVSTPQIPAPQGVECDLAWALGRVARDHATAVQCVIGDLPGGQRGFQVLATAAGDGPSTQLALARKLGVDRTVMTYLLDEIQEAGLVERRPDPADRRARRVVLTDAGRARLCDTEAALREAEARILAPLSGEEQSVLRTLLRRVATADGGSPDEGSSAAGS